MRKVVWTTAAMVALMSTTLIGTADASPDHDSPFEEHAHALVLGVQLDENENPIAVKRCVDLAANQPLPINAHHVHAHFGQAGEALSRNGNFVVPVAPFPEPFEEPVPWTDCASLLAFFGL